MKRLVVFCIITCFISCNLFTSKKKNAEEIAPNQVESDLTKLVNDNPKDAKVYEKRARYYHASKKDSLAINDYTKAIGLDSNNASYYSAIGDILFEHKDITGSKPFIQKAITLNPKDEKANLKLAKLFLFTKEYPKVFVSINTVLKGNAYSDDAYFLKGVTYLDMRDTNKAISNLQTCVQTNPKNKDGFILLGNIYTSKKDKLALQYFENAYKCDTSKMDGIYAQGMYYQNQEMYEEAKKIYKRIVLANKQFPLSYYNMGWIYIQQDSIEKAIRQFEMAISVKPDYAEAYFNKGLCYEINGNKSEAIKNYEQALSFDSKNKEWNFALTRVKK
jgi:tetratricopeptide (TPR) repeat protein